MTGKTMVLIVLLLSYVFSVGSAESVFAAGEVRGSGVPAIAWNRFLFPMDGSGVPTVIPFLARIVDPDLVLPKALRGVKHDCYVYGYGYADAPRGRVVVFSEKLRCFKEGTLPPYGVFGADVPGRFYGKDLLLDLPAKQAPAGGKTAGGLFVERGSGVLVQIPFIENTPVKRGK